MQPRSSEWNNLGSILNWEYTSGLEPFFSSAKKTSSQILLAAVAFGMKTVD
jgi:hypothetical protein